MENHTLSSESIVSRNRDLVTSDIDGEVVMMSIEKGNYYGMDLIGSRIWELIEQPVMVSDLIGTLIEEFEVTREICEKDVVTFLSEMLKENVVTTQG